MLGSRPFTSLELQNPSSTCKFTPTCSGTQRFTSAYNPFWPNRCYSKTVNPLMMNPPVQMENNEFLGNLYSGSELKRRGVVTDNGFSFEIVVDVCDFQPHEVEVKLVHQDNSVLVKGEQCLGANEPNNPRSASKKFCEKYYVPKTVNLNSLRWEVNMYGKLVIRGQHNQTYYGYGRM